VVEKGSYLPQLDGVRALAVTAVALWHWHGIPLGFAGVGLFFVMSGYLITGILLNAGDRATAAGTPLTSVARSFYIRRIIRLVPAHVVYLGFVTLIGWSGDPSGTWWYFTYLANFRIHLLGYQWAHYVSHLWTLAVEEQFYMIVPVLCFLVKPERLFRVLIVFAAFSFLAGAVSYSRGITQPVLPPAVFFGLLCGCLLSVATRDLSTTPVAVRWCERLALPLMLGGYARSSSFFVENGLVPYCELLFYLGAVGVVSLASKGALGRSFELRPVLYLGRISYGLYLWHLFGGSVAHDILPWVDHFPAPVQFLVEGTVTVAIASISYHSIEKLFLPLKDRFPYIAPEKPVLIKADSK